jgi:hypothetical protein
MDNATIQTLIGIQKDQTALIYNLWNVYQGLSVILLGYVFSQDYVRKNPIILACFSASILFFSVGNHNAIARAQELVVAATAQLTSAASTQLHLGPVLNAFHAVSVQQLSIAHITFTLFVTVGIWIPFIASRVSERLARVGGD